MANGLISYHYGQVDKGTTVLIWTFYIYIVQRYSAPNYSINLRAVSHHMFTNYVQKPRELIETMTLIRCNIIKEPSLRMS